MFWQNNTICWLVIRVGNSDEGLTRSCPPQNCPSVGIFEVSNSDIHPWDHMKWNMFEIEISLTMKDPWGGVNKMQIQMWCRTLRQIGRAPCTTAISNREHWACIVYRPSVYCTQLYTNVFLWKYRCFVCFVFLQQKHVVSSIPVRQYILYKTQNPYFSTTWQIKEEYAKLHIIVQSKIT